MISTERNLHELKTLVDYFKPVVSLDKTFEVRKNDRNYNVGDVLCLKEIELNGSYTGNECVCVVTYVFNGGQYGVDRKYAVLGIKLDVEYYDCNNKKIRNGEGESCGSYIMYLLSDY